MITSGTRDRQQLKAKQNLKIQISWTFSVFIWKWNYLQNPAETEKTEKKKKEKKTND